MPPKGITALSLKTWAVKNTRPIILCLKYCWALRSTPDLQKSSEGRILKTYQAVALFGFFVCGGFFFVLSVLFVCFLLLFEYSCSISLDVYHLMLCRLKIGFFFEIELQNNS